MLEEVMRHCHNFFVVEGGAVNGQFKISGGMVSLPFLKPGQYFRITGSTFNDGVRQYGMGEMLTDEVFEGTVEPLAVPRAFLELCQRIQDWNEKNGPPGPFQSENFGGYSYSRATSKAGDPVGWKDAFKGELVPWRKLP